MRQTFIRTEHETNHNFDKVRLGHFELLVIHIIPKCEYDFVINGNLCARPENII